MCGDIKLVSSVGGTVVPVFTFDDIDIGMTCVIRLLSNKSDICVPEEEDGEVSQ